MSNLNNFNRMNDEEDQQQKEETRIIKIDGDELSVGDYLKSKFVSSKAMPICVVSSIRAYEKQNLSMIA